ncbi:ATP-NAD kinase [Laetiporus sulphureus 93-53]|uniref:ATP-NAD kinase n=1 Tax=Laetiporus sulphureus 93-53 TaxID=1314785 RepID=A0A165DE80_9APHY|nr:ATP-NAD kinase [Laetiporus sulphureus 93-53]KZT04687.1 ATP-NAD kinase [Laetiporus sulphureus 93-53]
MYSPELEVFSTPPSTPDGTRETLRPSLSRRSSRPSNLRIQQSASSLALNVVVDDQASPDVKKVHPPTYPNGGQASATQAAASSPAPGRSHHAHLLPSPATSPCFVHSQLQGVTIQEYLQVKKCEAIHDTHMDFARSHHTNGSVSEPYSSRSSEYGDGDDDDDYTGSLTRQLAETAVGVREMSKQLGRTRVHSHVQNVLIVTKARDNRLIKLTRQVALYLMLKRSYGGRGMVVYVDAQLRTSRRFDAAGIERDYPELFAPFPQRRASSSSLAAYANGDEMNQAPTSEGQLRYWTAEMCSRSPQLFDFVITLGGDGTVLFTSWLFQRIVPPVLPFALGSLGFLTNFDFADHEAVMDGAIEAGVRVNLRMRFTCTVYRAVAQGEGRKRRAVKKADTGEILMKNVEQGGWEALESGLASFCDGAGKPGKDKEIMCFSTRPVESFEVLNDLVVDRGPSPYVSLLELFGDEHHLTTVQADGLCVSTPTGSTAYSLSAGGSLVHPEIPAILITPICPHTLSFRPMLLPDSVELRICVPFNSRSTAWASFDGRGRVELKQGDHIKVTPSKYPFPTVCADTQSTDWFNAISRTLKWNQRERQKSFVVVEESPSRKTHKKRQRSENGNVPNGHASPIVGARREEELEDDDEEDDCSDDGEDEEKYDIDDLSSSESPPAVDSTMNQQQVQPEIEQIGKEKAIEAHQLPSIQAKAETAARLLAQGNPFLQSDQGRPGLHSGVETPDRFACPHPHPPKISPRHVQFVTSNGSSSSDLVAMNRDETVRPRRDRASRDESHQQPRRTGQSRSRTPRTREAVDADSMKTPRAFDEGRRRPRSRSRSRERPHEGHARRAFAVWGQDESDSATSDSDT